MQTKLLTLRFDPDLGAFDVRPLEEFVRDTCLLAVREHLFFVHEVPYLLCVVTVADAAPRDGGRTRTEARSPDPTPARIESLPAAEQALFATLREWRTERARRDGVPPYVVLTNRELLAIVQRRPSTSAELADLPGIGAGKTERYGAAILARVARSQDGSREPAEAIPPADIAHHAEENAL
jgi:superfamily II DNA helicase RecQ